MLNPSVATIPTMTQMTIPIVWLRAVDSRSFALLVGRGESADVVMGVGVAIIELVVVVTGGTLRVFDVVDSGTNEESGSFSLARL